MNAKKYLLRDIILIFAWLACFAGDLVASPKPEMRTYAIDMPKNVLRFSLPEDVARQIRPQQIESRFDPMDPAYLRDGFRIVAIKYLQFGAPFWSGLLGGPATYGGLEFNFCVVKRLGNFKGGITSLDGLDRYVQWWIGSLETGKGFKFGRATIMDKEWVYRWRNTIGGAPAASERETSDEQAFAFPIDENMFLEVRFWITDYAPNSSKSWKKRADAIREEIKATIVLEPKKSS
jgi:hypothetical protein